MNDFKAKICDNLESLILTSDDNERSIEAYSNVLKHCLANSSGNLPELKSHLNNYANKAVCTEHLIKICKCYQQLQNKSTNVRRINELILNQWVINRGLSYF